MILDESELRCDYETRFRQATSYEIYRSNGRGKLAFFIMVVSKKNRKLWICMDF